MFMEPVSVSSTFAEWPRDVWREKLMTLEERWQGEQIWRKEKKEADTKSALIELKAMEVRHFLNKWNLKCNKDELGATTDKM